MVRCPPALLPLLALLACAEKSPPPPPQPRPALPALTGLTPAEGYAGDRIVLQGRDLFAPVAVTFASERAEVVSASLDEIVVRVPDDLPAGPVEVRASFAGFLDAVAPIPFLSLGQGAIRHQVVSDVISLATLPRSLVVAGGLLFARSETYGLLLNSGVVVPHHEGALVAPVDVTAKGTTVYALVADGDSGTLLAIDAADESLPVRVVARGLPADARIAAAGAAEVVVAEASCADCKLRMVQVSAGAIGWVVAQGAPARRLALGGDGRLLVEGGGTVELFRYTPATPAVSQGTLDTPAGVVRAAPAPDAPFAVVLDSSSRLWWFDTAQSPPVLLDGDADSTNGLSPTPTYLTNASGLLCDQGCQVAYVSFPRENRVLVVGRGAGVQGAIGVPSSPGEMALDGRTLYVSMEAASRVAAVDTTLRAVVDDQIYLNTGMRSVAVEDSDGNLAAYAIYLDSVVRLTPSGRGVRSFAPLSAPVDLECLDLDILDQIPPLVSPGDGSVVVWRGRRVEVQTRALSWEIDAGACIRRMVVAGGSGRIFLETALGVKSYDLGTGRLLGLVALPGTVEVLAAAPWGVVVGARLDQGAEVFALDASGVARSMNLLGTLAETTLLAPARDNALFFAVGYGLDAEKYLFALDRKAGLVKKVRAGGAAGSLGPMLVSPSGRRLYSLAPGDFSTRLIAAPVQTEPCCDLRGRVAAIDLPATAVVGFAQAPKGDRLYVLDEDRDQLVLVE